MIRKTLVAKQRLRYKLAGLPLWKGIAHPARFFASNETSRETRFSFLNQEEKDILDKQRSICNKTLGIARRVGNVKTRSYKSRILEDILPDDQSIFSVVLAGEFNAGKSTVINAILGNKILQTGSIPTTDLVTVLTHSNEPSSRTLNGPVVWHRLPSVPSDLALVDTPGTNAVLDHTMRTLNLLPTADLILFCTSAERPFPQSERELLKSMQAYRKIIVIIINKMDILETAGGPHGEEEKQRVLNYVLENASDLLGARPIIIPISARDALVSKTLQTSPGAIWERSNFSVLEEFLDNTLSTETKIKSKLANPLGVAEVMLNECMQSLGQQQEDLHSDLATINILQNQFDLWMEEIEQELELFRENMLAEFDSGTDHAGKLVERVGITRLMYLSVVDAHQFVNEWNRSKRTSATANLEVELLKQVRTASDSIAARVHDQSHGIIQYLGKRPIRQQKNLIGSVSSSNTSVDRTRRILSEEMSENVRKIFGSIDERGEATATLQSCRQSATMASSAIMSGAAISALTSSGTVDIIFGTTTTLCCAGLVAWLVGSSVSRIRAASLQNWRPQRSDLDDALKKTIDNQMAEIRNTMLYGVAPYTRFVQSEDDRIKQLVEESNGLLAESHTLRNQISKLKH